MNPILIVDDEAAIAMLVRRILTEAGYRCQAVTDSRAAANLLEKNRYDLVLLDVMMPHLDGYDLLAYLRPTGTPCIFITAKDAVAERVRGPKIVWQFFGQLKLGQEAKRTYLVPLGGIFAVVCHKDQNRILADRAYLPRQRNAVHIAHINVQKNHVSLLHGCLFQRVGVMDAFDLHITAVELRLCFDQSFQCFGKYRVIVTQQNVQHTVTGFYRWIFSV